MNLFRSADELSREIARTVSRGSARYIGIDGKDGSGKTTLAQVIAAAIGGIVVSLDDYVEKNRGGYVPHLRVTEINAKINKEARPIVIEGVCLLAATERIGIKLERLVYVKKVSPYGIWADEDECAPTEPVEEFIEKKEKELREFAEVEKTIEGRTSAVGSEVVELPELVKEVIRYHAKYKPIKQAQYMFERTEA